MGTKHNRIMAGVLQHLSRGASTVLLAQQSSEPAASELVQRVAGKCSVPLQRLFLLNQLLQKLTEWQFVLAQCESLC